MKYLVLMLICWQGVCFASSTGVNYPARSVQGCELYCDNAYPNIDQNDRYIQCYQRCSAHVRTKYKQPAPKHHPSHTAHKDKK